MERLTGILFGRILVIWLGLCLLSIGCTSSESPTETASAVAEVLVTRVVPTATTEPTRAATRLVATERPTLPPTDTAVPSQTPMPTQTPSPWLVENFSAFVVYNEGNDIYLLRPNGERRLIGRGILRGAQPWSPDGLKLVISPPDGNSDNGQAIRIANLGTGEVQELRFDYTPYGTDFDWSPDGNFLFYEHAVSEKNIVELRIYDLEQGRSELLVEILQGSPNNKVLSAGWSPDGRMVAFIAKINEQYDLFVIEKETKDLRQLTSSEATEVLAAWSPISNQLILGTNSSSFELTTNRPYKTEDFQLIDETGSQLARLDSFEGFITTAAWSPDGQQIAYSINDALCVLKVSDFSSTCPFEDTVLNSAEYSLAWDSVAAWSIDGKWLAFQAIEIDALQCYQLFFFDLSTNALIDPKIPSCSYSNLYWSRGAQ